MGQGARILLVNKTPYVWNKVASSDYEMNSFKNNLPNVILPGEATKVYIEWKSGSHDNDSAGEVFYELAQTGGLRFQVWARGRKRPGEGAEEGLSIYFENLKTGQQGKQSWLNLGWQHDGSMGFVLSGKISSFFSSAISGNPKWMSFIDGDKKLSSMTIPGTHDSCTYTNWMTVGARCQDRDIASQLNMGIRFLDIRLKIKDSKGKLYTYHGAEWTHVEFADVLQTCYDFLTSNPSETIMMSLKHENNDDAKEEFDNLVKASTEQEGKAQYWHTGVQIPRLREVRGKIVLFRRYDLSKAADFGIEAKPSHWPGNMPFTFTNDNLIPFDIQDEYTGYTVFQPSNKFYNYVRPCLDRALGDQASDTVFVNFISGTGGLEPRSLATGAGLVFEGTNRLFSNWLQDVKGNRRVGIAPIDFPEYPDNGILPSQLVYSNDFNRYETKPVNGCVYEIHASQALGSNLNVHAGGRDPGTAVILFHVTDEKHTQWKLGAASDNLHFLSSQHAPEMVLSVKDGKTANQTATVLSSNTNTASQRWSITPKSADSTFFFIRTDNADKKALELFACNVADGTPATLYDFNSSAAQQWAFLMVGFAPDSMYVLSPRAASQSCLERRAANPAGAGLRAEIQPIVSGTSSEDQQWKLAKVPNEAGWYYIETKRDHNQVLDVEGLSKNDKANTILHGKKGGDNQKWRIESCGNGYFTLTPKHAQDKVLELYSANTSNGTKPSLYTANGSIAQQWILRPV